jgi:hypothetical protein
MAVVLMPKRRQTIPIAHADPTTAQMTSYHWLVWTYGGYTTSIIAQMMQRPGWLLRAAPFLWQAIEHAYGRQLNTEVRQQITTVTTQYLKDCAFDRTVAPKAMARERIKCIHRAASNLEKVMRGLEGGGAGGAGGAEAGGGPEGGSGGPEGGVGGGGPEGGVGGGTGAGPDLGAPPAGAAPESPFSASTDELSREQQQSAHSYADGLIRQHLDERRSRARDKLHHFRDALKSLIVACDCARNDLSAAEGYRGQAWDWWIQALTRIAQKHGLPAGVSTELDREGRPLPFVRLVEKLESYLPADARPRVRSPAALAMAIARGRNT